MQKLTFLFAAAIACALGCDSAPPAASAAISLSEFYTGLTQAHCELNIKCCTTDELATKYSGTTGPATAADCKSSAATYGAFSAVVVQISIDKKRLKFDASKAQACLTAAQTLACTGTAAIAACAEVTTPLVAKDGACGSHTECFTGYCTGAINTDGKCADMPKEGEACNLSCVSGNYCSFAKCAKKLAGGEACDSANQCASDHCNDTDKKCGAAICDGK